MLLSFLLCLLSVSAQSLIPSLKKLEYMQHKWGTSEDHAAYFQLLKKKKKILKRNQCLKSQAFPSLLDDPTVALISVFPSDLTYKLTDFVLMCLYR